MYDNGVLSFIEPGQPYSLPPWQWSSQPLDQTQAKYFIAPLWADIAPVAQTTYGITQTANSAKFSWNNIAEYYSRGGILRLNSFSVEIDKDGNIATKYFGLNLRTSNISIGYKGDTDYTQISYQPYGSVLTSLQDWSGNTKVTIPTVKQEPIIEETVPVQTTPQNTVQTTVQATAQTVSPSGTQQEKAKQEQKVAVKPRGVDISSADDAVSIALNSATSSSSQSSGFGANQSNQSILSLFNQATNQSAKQDENVQAGVGEKKDALDTVIMNSLQKVETVQESKDKGMNKSVVANLELGQQLPLFSPLTIPDAPFYMPKQIYRNQRVVDNSRLLRSLNSDRKYLEMIDGQYR